MRDLAGRTAIVTGASRGIGKGVALALAAEGMRVVLTARTAPNLDALAETIRERGGQAAVVTADLSDRRAPLSLIAAAEEEFGPPDVLVNNAGVEGVYIYDRQPLEEIEEVIEVNLLATMRLTRLVLPGMLERRRGHIVNMSSLAGKLGPAHAGPYAASKAAMIAFTQSLRATYYGSGVSASVICPGFVDAGMYADNLEITGTRPPRTLGVSKLQDVERAVVRAIERDLPEVIVNPRPIRPWLALQSLAPGFTERAARSLAANALFDRLARRREASRGEQAVQT
jgi:short-subunit dehydrogenase